MIPLLLAACSSPTAPADEATITVELVEGQPTVARVAWEMVEPGTAWVTFGPPGEEPLLTPVAEHEAGPAEAVLLGMRQDTEVELRLHVETAAGAWESEPLTLTTGIAEGAPALELVTAKRDPGAPWVLGTVVWEEHDASGAFIADETGAIVWSWQPPFGQAPAAHPSPDGRAVLVLVEGKQEEIVESAVVRVELDGSGETWFPVPYAHHDFVVLPEGTLAVIAAEPRHIGDLDIVGDQIVEVAEDGTQTVAWSAFDTLPVDPNRGFGSDFYAFGEDWTHANGLAWDEDAGEYLVSLYWEQSVLAVDRATGAMPWVLGGQHATLAFAGEEGFGPGHAPSPVDGGFLLFDNAEGGPSRLVRYALDLDAGTASPAWTWSSEDELHAYVMGDVDPVGDEGMTLSAWGDAATILAVDADGVEAWRVRLAGSGVVGKVSPMASLYP